MRKNKFHWYDGWIYDKFIAPNQSELFSLIYDWIPKDSSVLDIGCGTGRFLHGLSRKCNMLYGIDLSERNIKFAKSIAKSFNNIHFTHGDLISSKFGREEFDYATISFVIHEMPQIARIDFLRKASEIAKNIIVADYNIPLPFNTRGILNRFAEFFAGPQHFMGYISFVREGGLEPLTKKAGLEISAKKFDTTGSSKILLLNKL